MDFRADYIASCLNQHGKCTATRGKASSAFEITGCCSQKFTRWTTAQPTLDTWGVYLCVSGEYDTQLPTQKHLASQSLYFESQYAKARSSSLNLLLHVHFCVVISRMQKLDLPLIYGVQTEVNFEYPKLFKRTSHLSWQSLIASTFDYT